MTRPFCVEGPAAICFSGGRTSAYMLYRILEAHRGKLPDDVYVCFQNTGVERNETLDFVEACAQRWKVPVVWQEYRRVFFMEHYAPDWVNYRLISRHPDAGPRTVVVDHTTAARRGRPFFQLLKWIKRYRQWKGQGVFLPNPTMRVCTNELKQKTMKRWLLAQGVEDYTSVLGIRADEPKRLSKSRGAQFGDGEYPLAQAEVTKEEVLSFWKNSEFDLQLDPESDEGNCTLCFMKARGKIENIMRKTDEHDWFWITAEKMMGAGITFRQDRPSYAEMRKNLPVVSTEYVGDTEGDCFCGIGD